jgi:ribonuclease P protein component
MFAKKNRLGKTSDVQKTFAVGRGFFNPYFSLRFVAKAAAPARITVVVSTKVAKRAVVRNKIKRVVREQIRLRLAQMRSGDYAIVARPAASKLAKPEIKEQILKLLVTAKFITHA